MILHQPLSPHELPSAGHHYCCNDDSNEGSNHGAFDPSIFWIKVQDLDDVAAEETLRFPGDESAVLLDQHAVHHHAVHHHAVTPTRSTEQSKFVPETDELSLPRHPQSVILEEEDDQDDDLPVLSSRPPPLRFRSRSESASSPLRSSLQRHSSSDAVFHRPPRCPPPHRRTTTRRQHRRTLSLDWSLHWSDDCS